MASQIARKVNQHLNYAVNLADSAQNQSDRGLQQGLVTSACLQMELALGFYVAELQAKSNSAVCIFPLNQDSIKAELADSAESNAHEFLKVISDADSAISLLFKWLAELRFCTGRADLKNPLFATEGVVGEEPSGVIFSSRSALDNDLNQLGAVAPERIKSVITLVREFVVRQRQSAEEY